MSVKEKKYTIVELVGMLTRGIGDIEVQFIRTLSEAGLTARQLDYLEAIHRLAHPNFGELARELGLSKPSVTAIVDKFVALGYVEKVKSDKDRRSAHVHLTGKGKRFIMMHEQAHVHISEIFTRNLNKRELDDLVVLLNKVVAGHFNNTGL